MEPEIVLAKLESLSRCISRIEEKHPQSIEILKSDYDLQDIIVLNLERMVQLAVDAGLHILADYPRSRPSSMVDVFSEMAAINIIDEQNAQNLIMAVGFRNIAVHEYCSLDWTIVWSILENRLSDFKVFSRSVLNLLEKP